MNRSFLIKGLLIVGAMVATGCSSPADSTTEELADGTFTARIDGKSEFNGEAGFAAYVPTSDDFPEAYTDSVLFLSLKANKELSSGRGIILYSGISLNTLWKDGITEFDLKSTTIQNHFIDPRSFLNHNIHAGTVEIEEQSPELLVGTFDLEAVDALENGNGINITGAFRAIRKDPADLGFIKIDSTNLPFKILHRTK